MSSSQDTENSMSTGAALEAGADNAQASQEAARLGRAYHRKSNVKIIVDSCADFAPEVAEALGVEVVHFTYVMGGEEHADDPVGHTTYAGELIRAAGGSEELVRAIQSHNSDNNPDLPAPELPMEKVLFAVDELTGLIGAAVIMRPSKSVMDFEVKSLKKKFKDKRFAAGCNRDVIRQGAELCGMELDELFSRTIDAMKAIAPDRDTFGK